MISVEVDERKALAEGLVMTLTGGDTVSARFLYNETFEFRPAFKLLAQRVGNSAGWLSCLHAAIGEKVRVA